MKCCIVKELLPNYIDGLTGEEANEEIRNHLEICEDCRKACEQMSAELSEETSRADNNIDFLKKMRGRLRKRYAAIILLTCAALISLIVFAKKHSIAIPYDPECMTTEIYQAVRVHNKFGIIRWEDQDLLDFETSKTVIEGKYDTIDLVRLVITEPALWDGIRSGGRTITRGDKEVRVVYYCYTRTLWSRMFSDYQERPNKMVSAGDIYGSRLYRADYKPVMTEIYYLPMSSQRLERLSDKEFDAQREHAVPVWSGMN